MLGVGVTGTTWLETAGVYADSYVRRGRRWYFAHRDWANVGAVRHETVEMPSRPGALSPADVGGRYHHDRAARHRPPEQ